MKFSNIDKSERQLLYASIILESLAEIKSMDFGDDPRELIPNPGPGKFIWIERVAVTVDPDGTAFTGGGALQLKTMGPLGTALSNLNNALSVGGDVKSTMNGGALWVDASGTFYEPNAAVGVLFSSSSAAEGGPNPRVTVQAWYYIMSAE